MQDFFGGFIFFFGGGGGCMFRGMQTFQSWSSETDEVEKNAASTHSCMHVPTFLWLLHHRGL